MKSSRFLAISLMFAGCIYITEIPLVNLLLPELGAYYGSDTSSLQMISISYGLAVALSVIVAGWLGDKFGLRPVILSGIAAFGAGSLITSFAADQYMLILGRVFQGIGGGLFSPLIPAALVKLAPDRPGRSLAIWNMIIGVVIASTPLLAVPILDNFGWRPILAALGVSAVLAWIVLLVIKHPFEESEQSPSGAVDDHETNTLSKSLPILSSLMIYVALNYGVTLLFLFWAPLEIERLNFSSTYAALVLSITWLSFGVIGFMIRRGIDTPMIVGYMFLSPIVLSFGWLIFIFSGGSLIAMVVGAALVGAGLGFGNAPSTLLIIRNAPKKRSSFAVSMDVSFARLGGVVIIWMIGSIIADASMALAIALIGVLNLVCALPLVSRKARYAASVG